MATIGKLKNIDTGEELAFAIPPSEFRITRQFEYAIEPCLGETAPVVAFRSGNASELNFQVSIDQDADKECSVKKLDAFLGGLNKVQPATKSVAVVEFGMGSFSYKGYVRHFTYHTSRFDAQGNATRVEVQFAILSNGEYENGKK